MVQVMRHLPQQTAAAPLRLPSAPQAMQQLPGKYVLQVDEVVNMAAAAKERCEKDAGVLFRGGCLCDGVLIGNGHPSLSSAIALPLRAAAHPARINSRHSSPLPQVHERLRRRQLPHAEAAHDGR